MKAFLISIFAVWSAGSLSLRSETVKVNVQLYVANPNDNTNPSIVVIRATHEAASCPLKNNRENPWIYSAAKMEVRAVVGQQIAFGFQINGNEKLIFEKETVTVDQSHRPVSVVAGLYDVPTYYQALIASAIKAEEAATLVSGSEKAKMLDLFFAKMEEAANLVDARDTKYRARYTKGICDMVESGQKSEIGEQRVDEWFQWACREQSEKDLNDARTQLAKLTDCVARAEDASWRTWLLDELLKQAYSDGFSPTYGKNSLCDQLIKDKQFDRAFELVMLEMESSEAMNLSGLRQWCGRATASLRGMSEPQKTASLDQYKVIMGEEKASGDAALRYLKSVLRELDVIAAGG